MGETHLNQFLDFLEFSRPDSGDIHDIFDGGKPTVFAAVGEDRPSQLRTNAGQFFELIQTGLVDINLPQRRLRGRAAGVF